MRFSSKGANANAHTSQLVAASSSSASHSPAGPSVALAQAKTQGRGRLHGARRAAMGVAHPQGAERSEGPRRDRVRLLRESRQRRLRARDARIRREGQPADRRRIVRRRGRGAQGREGLSEDGIPDGLVGQAAGAELRGVRQLHPGAGVPDRHDRRRHDQDATASAWSAATRFPRSTG